MAKANKRKDEESLEDVVKNILAQSGCKDAITNERILTCFKTKMWSLLRKWNNLKGGKQRKQFAEKLKSHTYQVKIYLAETNKIALVAQKRKLSELLVAKECKNKELSEKRLKANSSAIYWKNRFKNAVKTQIKQQRKQRVIKHSRKSFSDYSARSKYQIRNELRGECQAALDFIGVYDLIPTKVEYYDPFAQLHET